MVGLAFVPDLLPRVRQENDGCGGERPSLGH